MALVPGLLSIVLYYSGLRRTPAAVATLLELTFPVSAIAENALFLGERLQTSQLLAAAVLLAAVSKISLSGIRSESSH
jgi:drug/metabolite transporter (DMT)-like permease